MILSEGKPKREAGFAGAVTSRQTTQYFCEPKNPIVVNKNIERDFF